MNRGRLDRLEKTLASSQCPRRSGQFVEVHGERSLTLPAAEKVCDYLGLKLVREKRAKSLLPPRKPTPRPDTSGRKRG